MIGLKQMEKNGWDKYSYLMPTYRKEDIDRLKEKGVYNTIQDTLKDGFTIQETNHDYYTYNENNRDIEKKIPIYAVNKVPSREVSRDVASSLYRFRHMAHNFKSKSEIVGQVMFFQDLLKNRKTLETNSAGIQLIQKAAKQMGIDMPKLKEGESNNYKHVQEWLDSVMFGQSNLQQDFTIFGKTFSANEAVGTLNAFTAISTLSFNLLQGANQSILDNLMMVQESAAGQFLNKGDLAWAKGEYWSSGMAVTDIGRFDPQSKIGKAVEFFDALTEFTDSEGNQIVGGKSRKLARSGNLLFLQQAAEHELSATRMLALMKNLEGKLEDSDGNVIMNEDGKPANLYDMLIVDDKGKMSVDPRVANFSRLDFIMKLQGLSRKTNQIKSKMHTNMLQRRWWGKLFMLFRNWMPPGIGVESKLYTDLFGYMDTVAPENKNVNKVHKILRDHSIATKKFKNTIYVQQNNFRSALRDIKRINNKYPGLISTEYVKMTPQTIYSPAAELHVLTINEELLKRIPAEGTNNADITSDNQTDVDQYLRFAAPAAERDDAFLDELARRENTSNSKFSNLEGEELKNAYRVAGELQESFAKAGITVEVEFDTSIDNIGQVDAYVEGQNPIVRINPETVWSCFSMTVTNA